MKAWVYLLIMAMMAFGIGKVVEFRPAYTIGAVTSQDVSRQMDAAGVTPAEKNLINRK